MTEPLVVDPDRLNAASTILGKAAGEIPVELPRFSVSGSDALSLAIAAGSAQVEEPMAALPSIKAEALTVAENIGIAGHKYRDTDQLLGEKAKKQQFPAGDQGSGGKEPFSWKPAPSDLATGAAGGIAGAAHDYATGKAAKLVAPGDPLLNWTKELKVKGVEVPGIARAGGLLGVVTAIPGGIIDYSEAKAAGASTAAAVGQAVAREGAGTAAGLVAGGFASGIAADMVAGAAIGSVIPGAGTAVGLVVGAVVGGGAAFLASKWVGSLFG